MCVLVCSRARACVRVCVFARARVCVYVLFVCVRDTVSSQHPHASTKARTHTHARHISENSASDHTKPHTQSHTVIRFPLYTNGSVHNTYVCMLCEYVREKKKTVRVDYARRLACAYFRRFLCGFFCFHTIMLLRFAFACECGN